MLSNEYKSIAHKFVYHQYMSIFLRYLSKVNAKTMTKRDVYPLLRKYIEEPMIRRSFNNHRSANFKEALIHFCLKNKLFDLIVLYNKVKQ